MLVLAKWILKLNKLSQGFLYTSIKFKISS